jgi:hypothetical protein
MKDKMNITIEGTEKNKSEIIYNNLLNKLETKDAKIEYLKERLTHVESDNRSKMIGILTVLLGTIGISLSYFFLLKKLVLIGIPLGFISFFGSVFQLYRLFKKTLNVYKSDKFDEIENLYNKLNEKLK